MGLERKRAEIIKKYVDEFYDLPFEKIILRKNIILTQIILVILN